MENNISMEVFFVKTNNVSLILLFTFDNIELTNQFISFHLWNFDCNHLKFSGFLGHLSDLLRHLHGLLLSQILHLISKVKKQFLKELETFNYDNANAITFLPLFMISNLKLFS
jgi:hypothetical protein